MSDFIVIYDDREPIADVARTFIGVHRYSQLLYRKQALVDRIVKLFARSGLFDFHLLTTDRDAERINAVWENRRRRQHVIYYPSCLAPRDEGAAEIFIQKLQHVRESFWACFDNDEQSPLLIADRDDAGQVLDNLVHADWPSFLDEHRNQYRSVPAQNTGLSSLHGLVNLVEFLSSTFDVRHFNAISQEDYIVTKRSSDVAKVRREHQVFSLLPPKLRSFFLPPLDFTEHADGTASYQIERLCIPDMAIQWIHGVMSESEFAVLLDRLRTFLAARPVRDGNAEASRDLYVGKCERRIASLTSLEAFASIKSMLTAGVDFDLEQLLARFRELYDRVVSRRTSWRLCLSHGDLCFSNILYERQSRLLKFIDPRGADAVDELYLDEYYDIAKLSHSICGGYDFINHDLIELYLGDDLCVLLKYTIDQDRFSNHRKAFLSAMAADGYDPVLIRLHEAALFLSMLPLHVDHPKKVIAFTLTAAVIMDEIEQAL